MYRREVLEWRYRGSPNLLDGYHTTQLTPPVTAALETIGPHIPAGFETHLTMSGTLSIRALTVGSEEIDAFLSIFNTFFSSLIALIPYWIYTYSFTSSSSIDTNKLFRTLRRDLKPTLKDNQSNLHPQFGQGLCINGFGHHWPCATGCS